MDTGEQEKPLPGGSRGEEAFLEIAAGCDRKSDQKDEDERNNEQEWRP